MNKETEEKLVLIDVKGLSDEELISLGADLDNPIEIGAKLKNIGVPDRGIIIIMLNDYIKSKDNEIKLELSRIFDIYANEPITRDFFEDSIDNIIYSSIIRAIITPDNPPSYHEAIAAITKDVEDIYLNITSEEAPKEMLKPFISESMDPIAFNLFNVYNIETYNQYIEKFERVSEKRRSFIIGYRKAKTLEEKQRIQKEATEWESLEDRDLFIEEYSSMTHEAYGIDKAIDYIYNSLIDSIFPSSEPEKSIEKLNSVIPTKYIIPNNRMINKLSKGVLLPGDTDLVVSNNLKKDIITKVTLNYDDDNIEIYDKDKRFTPYDRVVHNAVCSIYEAGNTNFTPNQIYRAMNGLTDNEKVSPQAVGAVTKSIDKARRIYTKINYTEESKNWGKNIDNCFIEDHILSAKKIILEAGGNEVTGYKLNSKPILYEYAQVTSQVLSVPCSLLNTKHVLNSTPEVTVIREYLIRRIEVMKRQKNKNQSNKIRLDSIYKEIGECDPNRKKAQKVREVTNKLLGAFKENEYIKGHDFYKEGRAFKGIEVFY